MIRGHRIPWRKRVTCTRNEWQQVYEAIRHMAPHSSFTPEVAARCNKALRSPIIRECDEDHDKGEIDILISKPDSVNEVCLSGEVLVIDFYIQSVVFVRMEMIRATIKDDAIGNFAFLGHSSQKDSSPALIPYYVPEEKCLDASNALGMWFAKAQLPPNEVVNSPGPGHMLRAKETVWFRFNRRRFWAAMLCVSREAAESHKLNGNNYLISESLSGSQQFLLLPCLSRQSGDVAVPRARLRGFLDVGDITEAKMQAVQKCLFGEADDEVELDTHELNAPDVISGDFVIGGEKGERECITGVAPDENDLHGVHPQPQLSECENSLNLRRNIGANLAAVAHSDQPKVDGLPEMSTISQDPGWWECPASRRTVMNENSKLLFLKTTPSELEIQAWEKELEKETREAKEAEGLEASHLQDYGATPWPETPMVMPQYVNPMNGMPPPWGMPSFGPMPPMTNQWTGGPPAQPAGNNSSSGRKRSQSRGRRQSPQPEQPPGMAEYNQMSQMAAAMFGMAMAPPPAWPGAAGFPMPGMPWPGAPPAAPSGTNRDRSGSRRRDEGARKEKTGRRKGKSPGPAWKNAATCAVLKEFCKDEKAFEQSHSIDDILPYIVEFARDQRGQRFLNGRVKTASEREKIVQGILPEAVNLSLDDVGYKIVTKLLDFGTVDQKKQITLQLRSDVPRLSNDKHGCWVIQQAVEKTQPAVAAELVEELRPCTIQCVKDLNGNHVIQKVIEVLPQNYWGFILEAVENYAEQLSVHKTGCRVILRLIEYAAVNTMGPILDRIGKHIHRLSKDQYGNYVVQHILEHGRVEDIRLIMKVIQDDILLFAKDMCSSHVVEKCFILSTKGEHTAELALDRQALMQKVLSGTTLRELRNDKFGPFIIQTMKSYCTEQEQREIEKRVSQGGGRHR